MRITFITNYTALYGANRSLLNLIEGLKTFNVIPYVVVPGEGEITEILKKLEITYYVVPIQMWMHFHRDYKGNFFYRLLQYILYLRKDVFTRLIKNIIGIKKLSRLSKNTDIIYSNTSVVCTGILLAKLLSKPHVWHIREFGDLDYKIYFDFGKVFSKKIIQSSSAIISISKSIHTHFFGDNSSNRNCYIVYNGIATKRKFDELYNRAKKKVKSLANCFTFVIVGQLHDAKRQDEAIRAFKLVNNKYSNTKLILAGSGDDFPLRELVNQLAISQNVEFYGFVNDPFEVFLNADASLICSRNEGMGRVTVESMAACCPVIGYNNAGTSEIITHESTGLLYKNDHFELASCMIRLIEETKLSVEIIENAWIAAKEKYCTEKYSSQIYNIIDNLIK